MFTKDAKNVHILCDFWARASGMLGGSAAQRPMRCEKETAALPFPIVIRLLII